MSDRRKRDDSDMHGRGSSSSSGERLTGLLPQNIKGGLMKPSSSSSGGGGGGVGLMMAPPNPRRPGSGGSSGGSNNGGGSLLGLDRLAAEKRRQQQQQQQQTQHQAQQHQQQPSSRRQYRPRQDETPSHPGGVNRDAERRARERQRGWTADARSRGASRCGRALPVPAAEAATARRGGTGSIRPRPRRWSKQQQSAP